MEHIKFVADHPALLANKTMVISDLHIGVEHEFLRSGITIPSQTKNIEKRILSIIKLAKPEKLVILGDLKHKVPGISYMEMREIPAFIENIGKKIKVEIIPGNHDGGLEKILPDTKIHPSSGLFLSKEKIYLLHGHAWPSPDFLRSDYVVMGHSHPQVEFRNRLGCRWRLPVWVKAELNRKKIQKKYKTKQRKLPKLIIMPAFNELVGGSAINSKQKNEEFIGPLLKCIETKIAELYLLDGTHLGKLNRFLS